MPPAAHRFAPLLCLGLLLPSISMATILPTPTVTGSSAPLSGIYLGSWALDQANSEFVTTQGVGTFLEFDFGTVQTIDGFVNVTLVDAGRPPWLQCCHRHGSQLHLGPDRELGPRNHPAVW